MRTARASVALLCIVFTLTSFAQITTTRKPLTAFQQMLANSEQEFIAAVKKGDKEYFKRTLANDYAWVGMDGQLHDREEVVGDFGSGGVDVTPYNMEVLQLGDSAGIVTYDLIMRVPAAEDQGPPPRYQHWSTTWTREGDQWKIKFQQTTPTHWGDW